MRIRRLVALFVVLAMSLMLAACSTSDKGPDGYVNWQGMNDEYHHTIASFPYSLPPGVAFPADAPAESPDDYTSWYGVGLGELQAYEFAECAYHSIVVANETTDFEAAMKALDSAEEIHNAPFNETYPHIVIGPSWQSVIDKARLGDFSAFNDIYQTDCVGGWMGFK